MYYSFISCIFFKSIKYQTKNVRLHFLKEYIIYFACQTNMIWACLDFQKIKQQNFFFQIYNACISRRKRPFLHTGHLYLMKIFLKIRSAHSLHMM